MGALGRMAAAVIAIVAGVAGTSGRAAVILDSMVVRIYDNAGVLAEHRDRAIKGAHDILKRADVWVEWRDCPARGPRVRPGCSSAPRPEDLAVRFVRSPKQGAQDRALGHALIDSSTGKGTLATVFVDRVEAVAAQGRVDPWATVGRVMAHEIGHLLLGTNSHSETGLMREMWTLKDLTRNRPDDWLFSSAQRDRFRSGRLRG